jgi:peptide chain release factor 1
VCFFYNCCQNKAKAMKLLRSRIYEQQLEKSESEHNERRRQQIGTGSRSERIRTFNFVQGRVTDHRVGITIHNIDGVMEGDIDELIEACQIHQREKELERLNL